MVSVLAERQAEIANLCARFGVRRLEVFGSAASEEGFDPEKSDVDFIVECCGRTFVTRLRSCGRPRQARLSTATAATGSCGKRLQGLPLLRIERA